MYFQDPANDNEFDFSYVTPENHPVVRLDRVNAKYAAQIRNLADAGCFPIFPMKGEPVASVEDLKDWFVRVEASSWEA